MIRGLIEASSSMAVKDRAAERLSIDGIAITAARAVATGQHKLKLPGVRLAEQRHGGALKSIALGVVQHLAKDGLGILLAVQLEKYLLHQCLLLPCKNLADALFGDVPVIVDLFAQWMVEWKRHDFLLVFIEAAE